MREVLLVRALGGDDRDAEALRELGVDVLEDPYLVVAACDDPDAAERSEHVLAGVREGADWLVVTSRAALRALVSLRGADAVTSSIAVGARRGLRCAAVGATTAQLLRDLGADDVLVPADQSAAGLLDELGGRPPSRAVVPQGSQAMKSLGSGLRNLGWDVDDQVVYTTTAVAQRPASADRIAAGDFAAIVFRSPTALRAVTGFVPEVPESTSVICGGPTTAAEARRLGLSSIVVSASPDAATVAATVLRATAQAGS